MQLTLKKQNLAMIGLIFVLLIALIFLFLNSLFKTDSNQALSGSVVSNQRVIDIKVKDSTASPTEIFVKEGEKVKLNLDNNGASSCAETLFGGKLFEEPIILNEVGSEVSRSFTAPEAGEYAITCAMGMFNLKVNVL